MRAPVASQEIAFACYLQGHSSRIDRAEGGVRDMISKKDLAEWGSAAMVFISGGLAGHYASLGMNGLQWAGAAVAVLGSVSVAVAVRVWPAPVKAKAKSQAGD